MQYVKKHFKHVYVLNFIDMFIIQNSSVFSYKKAHSGITHVGTALLRYLESEYQI